MRKFLAVLFFSSFLTAASPESCKEITPQATRLKIIETEIEIQGKAARVFDIIPEDGDGSRIIQKEEGECFNLIVENQTSFPTGLHWHGLILPNSEDGVPYITQPPILPGKSYSYNFNIVQSGTYFAHSHFGLQEQQLMTIPLILLPKKKSSNREIILFLEDFTFQSIEEVWQNLRKDYVEMVQKTNNQSWIPPFMSPKGMHMPMDLNDVHYDAYLTNRKVLEDPDVYLVEPGEKIRLRLINSGTSTGFHIFLGDLEGELIAVDGNPIKSIFFHDFPLATAQRTDVYVTIPKEGGAFPILAQGQGTNLQTGLILKTKEAPMPSLSSRAKTTIGPITNSFENELRAVNPLKARKVDRKLLVELEGNMKYYVWAINNRVWPANQPLRVKEGERVEIEFINKTGMSHPMHLHGHIFQVTEIDNKRFNGALRDTVLVMPNQSVKVEFDATNPGIWPLHCHIAYHHWAGMFTVILYDGFTPLFFPKQEILKYSKMYGGY